MPASGAIARLEKSPLEGALAEARQLRFTFCTTWDPYEVWCTRVRAQPRQMEVGPATVPRDSSLRRPALQQGDGRLSAREAGKARSIPVRVWPVLLLALALGLNRELVGIFRIDLIGLVFGVMTPAARVVHVLLGISTICAVIVLQSTAPVAALNA